MRQKIDLGVDKRKLMKLKSSPTIDYFVPIHRIRNAHNFLVLAILPRQLPVRLLSAYFIITSCLKHMLTDENLIGHVKWISRMAIETHRPCRGYVATFSEFPITFPLEKFS
jgi:hypothetical protein